LIRNLLHYVFLQWDITLPNTSAGKVCHSDNYIHRQRRLKLGKSSMVIFLFSNRHLQIGYAFHSVMNKNCKLQKKYVSCLKSKLYIIKNSIDNRCMLYDIVKETGTKAVPDHSGLLKIKHCWS
jgi:hypothetical protein